MDIVAKDKFFPSFKEFPLIAITFSLTVFAWIFFRSDDLNHAFIYIKDIFTGNLFLSPQIQKDPKLLILLALVSFLLLIEWIGREGEFGIANIANSLNRFQRWLFYGFIIFLIGAYMKIQEIPFIYFQF